MTAVPEHTTRLTARAELYQCLAQAFLPPMESSYHQAMTEALPGDLDELLPGRGAGTELASAMATAPDPDALLRVYSRLFLVPPRPVSLNASVYMDGGIMGPTAMEIRACYQRRGVDGDAAFRGTPDHLVLQLRFLALLLASAAEADTGAREPLLEEARDFVHRFLHPWVGDMAQRLSAETARDTRARPYAVLGHLVREAVAADGQWLQSLAPTPPTRDTKAEDAAREHLARQRAEHAGQQHTECTQCGQPFAAPSELADMIRVLEKRGLGTAHLSVCPDCRAGTMGLRPTDPQFKEIGAAGQPRGSAEGRGNGSAFSGGGAS